jgi:hypothetical protein
LFIKIGQIGLKEKSEFIREKLSSLLNSKWWLGRSGPAESLFIKKR